MNDLKIFKNEQFGTVRAIEVGGEPWFVGKDVADCLAYSNSRKALSDHVDGEDKGVTKRDTLGGKQELTIINESGLYSLILGSHLPTAKQFKHWITSEVLPSIRKTGSYTVKNKPKKYAALPSINHSVEILRKAWALAGVDEKRAAAAVTGIYQQVYKDNGIDIPCIPVTVRNTYDKTQIAKKLGVLSKSDKPHGTAIGAIIKCLDIPPEEIEHTPYSRGNGHNDDYDRYTDKVLNMVRQWLDEHDWPTPIVGETGKKYYVAYRRVAV